MHSIVYILPRDLIWRSFSQVMFRDNNISVTRVIWAHLTKGIYISQIADDENATTTFTCNNKLKYFDVGFLKTLY